MVPLSMFPVLPQRQYFAPATSSEYQMITSVSCLLDKRVSNLRHPNTPSRTCSTISPARSARLIIPCSSNNENSSTQPPPPPPAPRRALGVDYGRKYIGLAVSTLGLAPRPLMNMRGGGMDIMMELAQGIIDAALAEGCDAIVIGLPVTSQGSLRRRQTDSQQGRRCRNFADAVAALTAGKDLFVYLVDERGTTLEAESLIGYLGGGRNEVKKKKDTVAAALILSAFFQNYRDAMRVRPPGMGRNTQPRRNNTAPSKGQKSNVEKKKTTTPVATTKETTPSRTAPHTAVDDTS